VALFLREEIGLNSYLLRLFQVAVRVGIYGIKFMPMTLGCIARKAF